jgi:hypothetical protein
MITAWYKGDHKKDGILARIGYWAIRFGQANQRFGGYTHCEAVFTQNGRVTIASASLRDGGVRIKETMLNPDHWDILDVPAWEEMLAIPWFATKAGTPYSVIGAMSSASLLVNLVLRLFKVTPTDLGQWCSRTLGEAAGVEGAEDMSVSELFALASNLPGTKDITESFFKGIESG